MLFEAWHCVPVLLINFLSLSFITVLQGNIMCEFPHTPRRVRGAVPREV